MIIFKRLSFSNILSVGNQPVSVDLDKCKTTLIHGTNGSGKSTILDALTYSLFGKSFRGVNLSQLINTQNKKGLLVECEFNIGNNEFLVRRGMKPKIFEVYKNGEILDAKAADKDNQLFLEQNILKLSYKSFTQIVILGSSNFVPFMQLNTTGRRECVEDFLDIKVFSTMSLMAKERLRGLKETIREHAGDMSNLEYKIDLQQQRIRELEKNNDAAVKTLEDAIGASKEEGKEAHLKLTDLIEEENDVVGVLDGMKVEENRKKAGGFKEIIIKLKTKVERLKKNILFYESNDVCHTCNQTILEETKEKYITESQNEIDEYADVIQKSTSHLEKHDSSIETADKTQQNLDVIRRNIFELNTELKTITRDIKSRENQITELQMNTGSVDKEEGKLEVMMEELKVMKDKKNEILSTVDAHIIVTDLLKDSGIKAQVVKKYLPAMNKFIRHYLTELDFPIHFQLDSEFNEQVHSPLHQDFSYQSFSEGQKGRIDLSLMLTWREVGRLKNSVSTNILILDEVFSSSLDDTGKECLLTLLRYRLPDNQRVLVVDHTLSDAFKEKFDYSVEVTRTNGFSRYS
jgi:DNA repair exonuclease SbcCD ATPase subunit